MIDCQKHHATKKKNPPTMERWQRCLLQLAIESPFAGPECLQLLLDLGADVNEILRMDKTLQTTALYVATAHVIEDNQSDLSAAEILVKNSANINATNASSQTPLH